MIHFYYGDNDFAIKRHVDTLIQKFAEKHGAENVCRIDGAKIGAQELLVEIVNINLFMSHRLIVLDGVAKVKHPWEVLGENLSRVPDDTWLIIVELNPDKRTKTFKKLKTVATVTEFQQLKDYELSDFVRCEATEQKVEIKPDAVSELITYTNGNQWRITSEIAKFRTLDKLVTVDSVRQFVEPELTANAFKLLEDLLNGRRDTVQRELTKLRQIEDANKFLGLLSGQIFALAVAAHSGDRDSREVAAETGVHPFIMSKMMLPAKRVDKKDVKRISQIISQTDLKMKSTSTDPWTLIELAIAKF